MAATRYFDLVREMRDPVAQKNRRERSKGMVGLGRVACPEPAEGNVRPGRQVGPLYHLLDPFVALHPLELAFPTHGLGTAGKPLAVHQLPGTAVLDGICSVVVVLGQALRQVARVPDLVP